MSSDELLLQYFSPLFLCIQDNSFQLLRDLPANQILQIIEPKIPLPPKHQISSGLEISEVKCKEGLELITKSNTKGAACVKHSSKISLIERGWGISTTE